MIKERGIIMQGWGVRAILDDRKTQTRRVIRHAGNTWHYNKLLCDWPLSGDPHRWDGKEEIWRWLEQKDPVLGDWIWELQCDVDDQATDLVKCPYGCDLLWIRETWARLLELLPEKIIVYKATDWKGWLEYETEPIRWRPSIHMPRWASRIDLEIVDIRVERVQEISDDDCWAEGIPEELFDEAEHYLAGGSPLRGGSPERCAFAQIWDSINKKRGFGWETNPWVWVISFKRIKA